MDLIIDINLYCERCGGEMEVDRKETGRNIYVSPCPYCISEMFIKTTQAIMGEEIKSEDELND